MNTKNTLDPNAVTINAGETTGTGTATFSNTGDGVITGVEPAKTPDQLRAEQAANLGASEAKPGNPAQPDVQTTGARMFSEDEVERFRQQEKEKMYGRVEELSSQLTSLQAEREAERKAKEEEQAKIEEEARKKAEEEMDVRELLNQTREELSSEVARARQEAETAQALLQKELELQELQKYREQALLANQDKIVPELQQYVSGDTPEQIDAALADVISRSDSIVTNLMAAQAQQVQGMQGTRPTAPSASGPLEEQQENRQISAEQIKNLSPSEYAALRGNLHAAGRSQFYGQR